VRLGTAFRAGQSQHILVHVEIPSPSIVLAPTDSFHLSLH
jgi:hypothetical protein